jgi:ribonuclease HI
VIHTDSQFSIDCLTTYKQKWTTNGFKKADGSDVSNADILAEIYNLWSDRITLVHVLAHQKDDSFNSVHNNIVDKLAFRAASNAKPVDK